jgi:hypothetical protein
VNFTFGGALGLTIALLVLSFLFNVFDLWMRGVLDDDYPEWKRILFICLIFVPALIFFMLGCFLRNPGVLFMSVVCVAFFSYVEALLLIEPSDARCGLSGVGSISSPEEKDALAKNVADNFRQDCDDSCGECNNDGIPKSIICTVEFSATETAGSLEVKFLNVSDSIKVSGLVRLPVPKVTNSKPEDSDT